HVIREDPANANLLFAGTEFGLFVSFNRGQNWERMKNGLPTVPVFDLQIHPRDHDLILATHGRSIWIMDNISALEELTAKPDVLTTDVHLFPGLPGIEWRTVDYRGFLGNRQYFAANPQAGLLLDYSLKAAGPVRVTVADKSGAVIRTINGRGEVGVNRLAWDMRMDPPVRPAGAAGGAAGGGRGGRGGGGGGGRGGTGENQAFAAPEAGGGAPGEPGAPGAEAEAAPGAGRGGGRGGFGGRGSLVDPGEYVVTLTAAGKSETRTVTVQDDPRSTITNEDRIQRRTAITKLSALAKQADESRRKVVAINTALTGLQDNWKKPNTPPVPDAAKKAVDDMMARVKAVLGTFEAPRPAAPAQLGAAGARGPYTPPPINQKITRLMGTIESYGGPPTAKQLSEVEDCGKQLVPAVALVNKVFDDMPALNKALAAAGVSYFTIDTNNVPAATFGRGGGER
ncbi:MAG: glycosyl hydrolase, repeat, partial [Candidatus Solibacter sp.]|nr:glycosyl hydrolase, repeat [Candidatus Solibacter sp.]